MKIEKLLADKDLTALRRLVDRSKKIKLKDLASSDVKILSVLKEAEGVMALLESNLNHSEKNFEEAESCFKEAFQHYHEIGHSKTRDMLILNTVSNILTGMTINPFSSPEAQM